MKVKHVIYFLLFFTLTGIVFAAAFSAGFVGDDLAVIPGNRANFTALPKILDYFKTGVWNHTNRGLDDNSIYRPLWLTWTFMVYQVAGEAPRIWHVSNLVLHALNAVLLVALLRRLYVQASETAVLTCGLLFLISPASSQNVIWIAGSTDLLLTTFVLAGLLSYAFYREYASGTQLCACLVFTVCAMLTKETGLIILPLYLLLDLQREKVKWPPVRPWILLIVTLGGYFILRLMALGSPAGKSSAWLINGKTLARSFEYASVYLRTTFIPWPLPVTLKHPPGGVATFLDPYLGVALLVILIYLAITRPGSRLAVGLILLPLGIPTLLAFNTSGLFATRFLYLSSLGLACLILPMVEKIRSTRAGVAVIMLALCALSALTINETSAWTNQGVFLKKLLTYTPQQSQLWFERGEYYLQHGQPQIGMQFLDKAESIAADAPGKAQLIEYRGKYYAEKGQQEQSLREFKRILDLPGQQHIGWTGIGNILWTQGRANEALEAYTKALAQNPNYFYALRNAGMLHAQLRNFSEAIKEYEAILRLPQKDIPVEEQRAVLQNLQHWRYEAVK